MVRRLLLPLVLLTLGCHSTGRPAPAAPAAEPRVEMRTYYFAILRRGPAWTPERTPEVQRLGEGHMANINRLAAEGKLLLAGPFLEPSGDPPMAGLFILKTESREEAEAWVNSDPAVAAGRFRVELVKWLGPITLRWP